MLQKELDHNNFYYILGNLVSAYECDPKLVEEQFAISKREYLQKTGRKYNGDVCLSDQADL